MVRAAVAGTAGSHDDTGACGATVGHAVLIARGHDGVGRGATGTWGTRMSTDRGRDIRQGGWGSCCAGASFLLRRPWMWCRAGVSGGHGHDRGGDDVLDGGDGGLMNGAENGPCEGRRGALS